MSNEYKRPYEYEEEKKGLITVFVAMILGIDTIQTIFFAFQNDKYMSHITFIRIVYYLLAFFYILYTIYTAVTVYRMKNDFVGVAKRYIIIRTIYSIINYVIIFLNRLKYENMIGKSADEYLYQSNAFMIYVEIILPFFFVILFCVLWYLYFTYSKRCRNRQG